MITADENPEWVKNDKEAERLYRNKNICDGDARYILFCTVSAGKVE